MKVLDLFSGIGGFSLGLERAGMTTVAFCEVDPFCRAVLRKHWPEVPIYDDVQTLNATLLVANRIEVDVICGGFPCQDISIAGKGIGLIGKRSGLWYEYQRLIKELRPKYAIIENVSVLRSKGLGDLLRSLFEIGYDAEWHCIPASVVGAPHRRDRIWIIAYPHHQGESISAVNAEAQRLQIAFANGKWDRWNGKPEDVRMDDGIPNGMDRVKALGNAIVPNVAEQIGHAIMGIEYGVDAAPK
jgi:DNA (cytosine-5)-methyltransferase 1